MQTFWKRTLHDLETLCRLGKDSAGTSVFACVITDFFIASLSVVSKEAAEGQAGDSASREAGDQSTGYATVFFEDTIEGQVESSEA